MANRPNILILATKISLECMTYTGVTYNDPEYRILEPIIDDDMCKIFMHLKLETNRTAKDVAKRSKQSLEFTQKQLDKLVETGAVRTRVRGSETYYYYPIWVPGIMEGILSNREQCDANPVIGECFEEYTRRRVAVVAPFMDAGMNLMRVIPVQSSIENNTRKASYDEVKRLVEKARAISVGPCSCRRARRLMGEGCGHLEEDMCIYLNDNAECLAKSGTHRMITKEEAYEIIERAEQNGLVHELNVANGYEDATAICNCCGCSCLALRIASYFNTPDAVKSNYVARIDPDKCVACGECVENCQINAVKLGNRLCGNASSCQARPEETARNTMLWMSDRYNPEFRTKRTNCTDAGTAPCKAACPAHVSVQGYLALAKQGRYAEALQLIKKDNPFPAICGTICNHPCEAACMRAEVDEAVSIQAVKKFIAEQDVKSEKRYIPSLKNPQGVPFAEKIAVIGAGPAGLSCAYYLKEMGYPVTVFEKSSQLGGLLRSPIHAARINEDVIDNEIQVLVSMGVEFTTGTKIENLDELRAQGYKAFFLATGAGSACLPAGNEPEKDMASVNKLRQPELDDFGIQSTEQGMAAADGLTLQTSIPDVFAGGDVRRKSYTVNAIADGKKAAQSIHRYVHKGNDLTLGRVKGAYKVLSRKEAQIPIDGKVSQKRCSSADMTEAEVKAETARCLGCGLAVVDEYMCLGCGVCTTHCKFDAIKMEKIADGDNKKYLNTLGKILLSVPGKSVATAKKHISRIGTK